MLPSCSLRLGPLFFLPPIRYLNVLFFSKTKQNNPPPQMQIKTEGNSQISAQACPLAPQHRGGVGGKPGVKQKGLLGPRMFSDCRRRGWEDPPPQHQAGKHRGPAPPLSQHQKPKKLTKEKEKKIKIKSLSGEEKPSQIQARATCLCRRAHPDLFNLSFPLLAALGWVCRAEPSPCCYSQPRGWRGDWQQCQLHAVACEAEPRSRQGVMQ